MKKRVSFHNLGCKVNAYETDVMAALFEDAGYETVPFEEPADVVVINTCTVTNIADRKSRQMLHRAKKLNPSAIVVAAGCYVTADAERALKDEGIDICIGNPDKPRIVEMVAEYMGEQKPAGNSGPECFRLTRLAERTRAYIKIQDGCNQFCSYCIIPFARGRTVSRSKEEILSEIRGLTAKGVKEFVITGIHVSSYGYDIKYPDAGPKADCFAPEILLDLLKSIDETEGVERIRLSSLEPRIITKEFAQGLKEIKGLCPHFHLSLQSGSDSVLKRMNRHYDTGVYENCVAILRDTFDDPAITTDVIVGFPGETEEEFEQSLKFAEKIGFYQMHIFKYSKRKGTVAAGMPGQLTEAQKAERSDRMEEIERKMTEAYISRHEGTEAEVLFEEEAVIDGQNMLTGYTREYVRVAVKTDVPAGGIYRIRLRRGPEAGILSGVEL
ncbi:MAG: tRNA (N(6)-L-threonylcarbamoyladenosine(37)-C(2))-methylthiotransferase MtaB [Lachnospiraceae bacterium]|nr:tRNA (N(6)-L-threonylcarbamoyladenosine(37)-C(2))-methylthiotransferase MtaB [Lachnospiraceae bacterium]